jgi:hypothetical protein
MGEQDQADTGRGSDLLSRRIARIGLDPARLTSAQQAILDEIRSRCPTCENPEQCAAGLAAGSADRGWEDWDEYCPNAARLRILAALTMFPGDGS